MPGRGAGKPDLVHLLERAYDSAFEPRPFASLLPELAAAVGADTAHINFWAPELGGELVTNHEMPDRLVRIYREHHWETDVWRHALERLKMPVGRAFAGHQIVPYRALIKSEMYNDALRGYGLFDICAGRIYQNGRTGSAVSLMRARGRPFYGRRELAHLGAMLPHMARALGMRLHFDAIARQRDAFAAFVDQRYEGVLFVGRTGRVADATASAQAMLDSAAGALYLDRGYLRARDAATDRRLQWHFTSARESASWFRGPAMIDLVDGTHRVRIVPTARSGGVLSMLDTAFLVVIEDRSRAARDAAAIVASRYGLTRAEAELLQSLAAGESLRAAAKRLARAQTTVRNQLQSIFAKTGTHRQAQLVAKVLGEAA